MITAEALEIVLDMAKDSQNHHQLSQDQRDAIEEVETLLKSYEDNDYDADEYVDGSQENLKKLFNVNGKNYCDAKYIPPKNTTLRDKVLTNKKKHDK